MLGADPVDKLPDLGVGDELFEGVVAGFEFFFREDGVDEFVAWPT